MFFLCIAMKEFIRVNTGTEHIFIHKNFVTEMKMFLELKEKMRVF